MIAVWLTAGVLAQGEAGPQPVEPVYSGGWFGEGKKRKPKPETALEVVETVIEQPELTVANTALADALAKAAKEARERQEREASQGIALEQERSARAAQAAARLNAEIEAKAEAIRAIEQDASLQATNAALMERAALKVEIEALKAAQQAQDEEDFLILAFMASF